MTKFFRLSVELCSQFKEKKALFEVTYFSLFRKCTVELTRLRSPCPNWAYGHWAMVDFALIFRNS